MPGQGEDAGGTPAVQRFHRAFVIAKEELILFFCGDVHAAGVGIYYFEHEVQPEAFESVFHSLWWAVVTGKVAKLTVQGMWRTGFGAPRSESRTSFAGVTGFGC